MRLHRACRPILALCAMLLASLSLESAAQTAQESRAALRAHGVDARPERLLAFLSEGWSQIPPPDPMPNYPSAKSSLLVNAWELLALSYPEVAGNSVLEYQASELARRYAIGDFPEPIARVIEQDAGLQGPMQRAALRSSMMGILRYNGMVALGLFGRPSIESHRAAQKAFSEEPDPMVRVSYATTLALLGLREGLDFLVEEVIQANDTTSLAAADELNWVLGGDFGIGPHTSIQARKEAARRLDAWWKEHAADVTVNRHQAVTRRLRESSQPPQPYPMRTLREILRAAADLEDMGNIRGSRTAWNRLDEMAKADAAELTRSLRIIAGNEMEDLDIRSQALRWLVRLEGRGARRLLRSLRRDPNPPISRLAQDFLDSL